MHHQSGYILRLLPTQFPLKIVGIQGFLWKLYAYGTISVVLILTTGGIGILYLFEVLYRLNTASRSPSPKQRTNALSSQGCEG